MRILYARPMDSDPNSPTVYIARVEDVATGRYWLVQKRYRVRGTMPSPPLHPVACLPTDPVSRLPPTDTHTLSLPHAGVPSAA